MPLLSENVNIATHGQVGKKYIYWVVAGEQFRRPYKIPADPKTFAQRTQRNKFIVASQMWVKLTAEEKQEWEEKVLRTQYTMTAYNFYIRKKIKEIKQMVKRIIRKTELLSDGVNVLTIPEIDVEKSALHYNCFLTGDFNDITKQYGIIRATIHSPTELRVHARDPNGIGDVRIRYQIIEYV